MEPAISSSVFYETITQNHVCFIYVEVPVFIVQIEDQNTFLNIFKNFYLYSVLSNI